MNLNQINRLVATVPDTIDARQRNRLRAHQEAASQCELRITQLRDDLERSLHGRTDMDNASPRDGRAKPATTLDIAGELDALERVQPRVDGWLADYVASLVTVRPPVDYGDGQPV